MLCSDSHCFLKVFGLGGMFFFSFCFCALKGVVNDEVESSVVLMLWGQNSPRRCSINPFIAGQQQGKGHLNYLDATVHNCPGPTCWLA